MEKNNKKEYVYLRLLLSELTANNINEFYRKNFDKFIYYQSENVEINGKQIKKGLERFLKSLPDKQGKTTSALVSKKTKSGFDLTEKRFIENTLHKIEPIFEKVKFDCDLDMQEKAKNYIDFLKNKLAIWDKKNNDAEEQIVIPYNLLNKLQKNGFIEDATAFPYKWLKNKQQLRELLTHNKIKGKLCIAKVEEITPTLFVDKANKPIQLAKNKKTPSVDSDMIEDFLATL